MRGSLRGHPSVHDAESLHAFDGERSDDRLVLAAVYRSFVAYTFASFGPTARAQLRDVCAALIDEDHIFTSAQHLMELHHSGSKCAHI